MLSWRFRGAGFRWDTRLQQALGAPLDVFVVRKLGAPLQPELAMGAIASGGVRVMNSEVVRALRITPEEIEAIAEREALELDRRERVYRGDRVPLDVRGRCVLLVDDGVATGYTMRAAVAALRQLGPKRIVVAVPVAAEQTCRELEREADAVVCLFTPIGLRGGGPVVQTVRADERRGSSAAAEALISETPPPGVFAQTIQNLQLRLAYARKVFEAKDLSSKSWKEGAY